MGKSSVAERLERIELMLLESEMALVPLEVHEIKGRLNNLETRYQVQTPLINQLISEIYKIKSEINIIKICCDC